MAMAYKDASHLDLQSLASEFPKLLEFYIAWSLLKQPDLDDVSRRAKTTVSEQSTGSTHPDRLAAFFEARNVHWRLGEDPLKIPEWVIVRSLLVLGYQKSTEASQNTASTPNAATSRTRALQVCISLNHIKGAGCQRKCVFEHVCMFCGRPGHGMWLGRPDGRRACRDFDQFEREYHAFEKLHFKLDRPTELLRLLRRSRDQKKKARAGRLSEAAAQPSGLADWSPGRRIPPPDSLPPPPPDELADSLLATPLSEDAADALVEGQPASLPARGPPRGWRPQAGGGGQSSSRCLEIEPMRVTMPPESLPPPPPAKPAEGLLATLPATASVSEGSALAAPPAKAPPAGFRAGVPPCGAPPGLERPGLGGKLSATTLDLSAYMGTSYFLEEFKMHLREAVPERCYEPAVCWILREQVISSAEVLENLQDLSEAAGIPRIPLRRLRQALDGSCAAAR